MLTIFPSLVNANVLDLGSVIKGLEPHCDGFHVDVMDNHFVPNLTWGPLFINPIAKTATKSVAVHLMVTDPVSIIKKISLKPIDIVIFHIEIEKNISEVINVIKEKKVNIGLALSPRTAVEQIKPFGHVIDQVLLMSVEPGASGQHFLPTAVDRLEELVLLRQQNSWQFSISMDGGINETNISLLAKKGCSNVAVASAIFDQPDLIQALNNLYEAAGDD
jgi:ribulose-phosphate 3-epimerase